MAAVFDASGPTTKATANPHSKQLKHWKNQAFLDVGREGHLSL